MSKPDFTIPAKLTNARQWVAWRYERRKGQEKPKKVPYDPTAATEVRKASATNKRSWGTLPQAWGYCQDSKMDGIGFVFAPGGFIFGIDVDNCVNKDGTLSESAQSILTLFPETYVEYSPSGEGIHIWGLCDITIKGRNRRDIGVEVYTQGRFFTVTGRPVFPGRGELTDCSDAFRDFLAEHFPEPDQPTQPAQPTTASRNPLPDDQDLIERAKAASNGAAFTPLWNGDVTGYPSTSEADLALCNLLAFWTGRDADRMDRLFRQSGLFRAGKWDRHAGHGQLYGARTIAKAIADCRETYSGRVERPVTPTKEKPKKSDLPPGFSRQKGGIYYSVETKNADGELVEEWVYLCTDFRSVAMTRDGDGEAWGLVLEIPDADGEVHEYVMPKDSLAGDGAEYRRELLSRGFDMASGRAARAKLHELLSRMRPQVRARCVSRCGWHERRFVLPDGSSYGEDHGERIVLQPAPREHPFRTAGNLTDWQNEIGRYAVGNSRLALAISCAPAAPLAHLLQVEGGGFHLFGRSSRGKTTTLQVAGSFCGGGGLTGFVRSWRATDNALEAVAAAHSDNLLLLDEVGQAGAEAVGAVVYMLSNQVGKTRARRDGSGRKPQEWRITWLSSGETEISAKCQEKGQRHMAGQEVRAVDIELRDFEHLHGFASGKELADHLKRAAQRVYGAPLREFLAKLTASLDEAKEAGEKQVAAFIKRMVPAGADGQVSRVAARFGLVAAAGEISTAWGVLPWPKGEATKAAEMCFNDWLTTRGGTEPAEVRDGIAAVRSFVAAHGQSRFQLWGEVANAGDDPKQYIDSLKVLNRAGFRWKPASEGQPADYLIFPDTFRQEVLRGLDVKAVCAVLEERGLLVRGDRDHWTVRYRIPQVGNSSFYHIRAEILDE